MNNRLSDSTGEVAQVPTSVRNNNVEPSRDLFDLGCCGFVPSFVRCNKLDDVDVSW